MSKKGKLLAIEKARQSMLKTCNSPFREYFSFSAQLYIQGNKILSIPESKFNDDGTRNDIDSSNA